MRVGVYFGRQPPAAGGVYTLRADLFQALRESPPPNHTFVVVGWEPTTSLSGTSIEYASLAGGFLDRTAGRIHRTAATLLGGPRSTAAPAWVEKAVLASRVDFICNFSQEHLTDAVPYLAMVLDLQHRLQPYFPEVSSSGEWEVRERYYCHVLQRAALIVCGTETGKREVERFYQVPPERIRVLPLPTPGFALQAQNAEETPVLIKYGLRQPYVLYPAQFWPHKNHIGLLEVVRVLRDEHGIRPAVVLVGSDHGNERTVRGFIERHGLGEQVRILGFVPLPDLVSLYRNAAALLYLSFFGPDNLPPLEAFALGCPVIASRVPGAEEQLGDAALLVDPRDTRQIVEAVRSIITDQSLRPVLVRRGRNRASRFSARDFMAGIGALLDEFEPIRRCWGLRFQPTA